MARRWGFLIIIGIGLAAAALREREHFPPPAPAPSRPGVPPPLARAERPRAPDAPAGDPLRELERSLDESARLLASAALPLRLDGEDGHELPEALRLAGRSLGTIAGILQENRRHPSFPRLATASVGFYRRCAAYPAYPLSLRTVCLDYGQKWAETLGERLDLSQVDPTGEIRELQARRQRINQLLGS
jgi:hypothetical protein